MTFIDATSGLMADFLRLIDVNAGGLRLKKGGGFFTYSWSFSAHSWVFLLTFR